MKKPDKVMMSYLTKLAGDLMAGKDESAKLAAMLYLNENPDKGEDKNSEKVDCNVGIWRVASKNGRNYYELNDEMADEWNFWAKVSEIPAKIDEKRIVFLGESVARGYFYDPVYNPSLELDAIMNTYSQSKNYEVIDTARTDLNYKMLVKLINQVTNLNPDAVVVFAGNNWDCTDFWVENRLEIAEIFKEKGISGVERYFNNVLKSRAENIYKLLNDLFASKNIPVVYIVPEFNLTDWMDVDVSQPWADKEFNFKCQEAVREGQALIDDGEYDEAIRKLTAVSDVDHKLSAKELNLLISAYKAKGDYINEIKCEKRAKDAALVYPKINTPRTASIVQDTLREEAGRYENIFTVDLNEVFSREGEKIGRSFFMDYCHLTSEGIQLAMSEAAVKLIKYFENEVELPDSRILKTEKNIDLNKLEAEAHFLAAIHNAHWGQKKEIIAYHLQKSAAMQPEIKGLFKNFLEFQNRKLPVWMSKNAKAYISNISEQGQRYLTENKGLCLDKCLTECILETLGEDIDYKKHLLELINHTYGFNGQSIKLLKPEYYVRSISQKEAEFNWLNIPERLHRYGYFAAYDNESEFVFFMNKAEDIKLKLTYRMRTEKENGEMIVNINGTEIYKTKADSEWSNAEITISAKDIKNGYNKIDILWSDFSSSFEKAAKRIEEDLIRGSIPEIVPIYGEIYDMTIEE